MLNMHAYFIVSSLLFALGFFGVIINRKNLISILLCIELMFLGVATNFIIYASIYDAVGAKIMALMIIIVTVAETAVGLAIVILIHKQQQHIDVTKLTRLKG